MPAQRPDIDNPAELVETAPPNNDVEAAIIYIPTLPGSGTEQPPAPAVPELPLEHKNNVPAMVGASILNLLQTAPENAQARALVMSRIGLAIPAELTTFEAIVKWLETVKSRNPVKPSFRVLVQCADNISGNCRFEAMRRGVGEIEITPEDVEVMTEGIVTWNSFRTRLRDMIRQKADESISLDIDMGTVRTSEHDDTENNDTSVDYATSASEQAACKLLKAINPDLWESLC